MFEEKWRWTIPGSGSTYQIYRHGDTFRFCGGWFSEVDGVVWPWANRQFDIPRNVLVRMFGEEAVSKLEGEFR
jgi:hypothetical protein